MISSATNTKMILGESGPFLSLLFIKENRKLLLLKLENYEKELLLGLFVKVSCMCTNQFLYHTVIINNEMKRRNIF